MDFEGQMYCLGDNLNISGVFGFGPEQQRFTIVEQGKEPVLFDVKVPALELGGLLFQWVYGNAVERKCWRVFRGDGAPDEDKMFFTMSTSAIPPPQISLFNEFREMLRGDGVKMRELRQHFMPLSPEGLVGLRFRIEEIDSVVDTEGKGAGERISLRFTMGRLDAVKGLVFLKGCYEDGLYLVGSVRIQKKGDRLFVAVGNSKFMPLGPEHINMLSYGISRILEGRSVNLTVSKLNLLSFSDAWRKGGVRLRMAGRTGFLSTPEELCRFGALTL